MLDRIIERIIDFFVDNEITRKMEEKPSLRKFTEILKNKNFMVHIIKYLLFGVLTTIFSLGTFFVLIKTTNLNENICNFLSIVVGILSAYALNREYVFESKEKNILKEFSKFVMARIFSSAFDMITFFIFATCLSLNEMIVKIVISVVVIILNYILSKLIVFKKKSY